MWEVSLEGRISAILKTGTFGFPMEMLGNIPKVMQWHVVDPEEPLETPDGRSQTEWRNTRNVSLVMADEKAQYEVFVGWLFDAMLEGDYLDLDERDEFRGVDTWARFWTLCGEVRDACTNEQMVRFLEGSWRKLVYDCIHDDVEKQKDQLEDLKKHHQGALDYLEAANDDLEEDFVWSEKERLELLSRR